MVQSGHSGMGRIWLSRIILMLLVLMIVMGAVTGGAYLYLRRKGPSATSEPVAQLRLDRIEPALALATLAGAGDLDVVNEAIREGELETAYATTLFSTQLTHREVVGNLLLLGQRYAGGGDKTRARMLYQQASLFSTMSPTLSDAGRAYAFVQIGGGLSNWGDRAGALSNYEQAFALALHSPFIRDPHRADLLGQLALEYDSLGERERAAESRTLQAEILYTTEGQETGTEGEGEQPIANFLVQIPAPAAAMVASYEEKRVEAVVNLIDALRSSSSRREIPQELGTEIAQAFANEDKARSTAYEDELAAASSMVLRIGIAQARVDWLLIKYRVASGAYGLTLVPAWSEDVTGIAAELNKARTELHDIYGDQIATFGDQTAKDRAWFDLLRLEILQGRLGLYPDYPLEELISSLGEVTRSLIETGDPSLHPEVFYEGSIPRFSLVWTE
jgi:hypothetical protein